MKEFSILNSVKISHVLQKNGDKKGKNPTIHVYLNPKEVYTKIEEEFKERYAQYMHKTKGKRSRA